MQQILDDRFQCGRIGYLIRSFPHNVQHDYLVVPHDLLVGGQLHSQDEIDETLIKNFPDFYIILEGFSAVSKSAEIEEQSGEADEILLGLESALVGVPQLVGLPSI